MLLWMVHGASSSGVAAGPLYLSGYKAMMMNGLGVGGPFFVNPLG